MARLCELTDVPARTVRYYIQVGLLDAPVPRGRHTTYDDMALSRLRAIRALRAAGVPLESIKSQVEGLAAGALDALADNLPAPSLPATTESPRATRAPRAPATVTPVLPSGTPTGVSPARTARNPPAAVPATPPTTPQTVTTSVPLTPRAPRAPRTPRAPEGSERVAATPSPTPSHTARPSEPWVRTVLVPGLEIHVRATAGALVDRLAREIIASYSVPVN